MLIRHLRLSLATPMNLIDWPALARNALWILGLSIVLAAWSYVSWLAAQRKVRTGRATGWPVFEVPGQPPA